MSERLIKNSLLVLIVIGLGKALSFLRDIFISFYFGASQSTDAYFAANNIPSLLFTALISSYLVLLIPTYKRIQILSNEDANIFGSGLVNFFVVFSLTLSLSGYVYMDFFVHMVAPGFNETTHNLSVSLGKILILSFPLSSIVMILATLSNANRNYYALHIIPLVSSLIIIVGLWFFSYKYGLFALAYLGVSAYFVQLIIQVLIAKKHFKYQWNASIFHPEIKKMTILAFPIFLGYSVDQVNLLVNSILASGLSEGSLSALTYAQRLQFTFMGTISTAVITVVYPLMSEYKVTGNNSQFNTIVFKSMFGITILIIPIAIFLAVHSEKIIAIIYGRGNFDTSSVLLTAGVFFFYALNIIFLSIREFLLRVFYIADNTKHPLIASVISVILNILLSLILVSSFQVSGLALANLAATFFSACILCLFLKRENMLDFDYINVRSFRKAAIPMACFGLIQWLGLNYLNLSNTLVFICFITLSFIIYYILLIYNDVDEIVEIHQKSVAFVRDKVNIR